MPSYAPHTASAQGPLLPSFGHSLIAFMSFLYCSATTCPRLEAVPSQWTAEQDNLLPCLAGHAGPGAPRAGMSLLAARTLLTQLVIDQDPQIPFQGTALQHLIPQSVHTSRVALSQARSPALSLFELPMVGDHTVFNSLASLQGLPAFEEVSSSSQICSICKLAQCPFQSYIWDT